jgi:hypothetical protein
MGKKKRRTPEQVADILDDIYEERFGGKKRGRYKISRVGLRQLSNRMTLKESIIELIIDEVNEYGYIMIEVEDGYALIEERIVANFRSVPKSLINKYCEELADEDEYEDEGEDDDNDE